jgi:hypothetical protein
MQLRKLHDIGVEIMIPRKTPWYAHEVKKLSIGMHPVFQNSPIGEPLYAISIDLSRYSRDDYNNRQNMLHEGAIFHNYKNTAPSLGEFVKWQHAFHLEISSREFEGRGWLMIRKDIRCPNKDILVIVGSIFLKKATTEEIKKVKYIINSIIPIR